MDTAEASRYLRDNYESTDRVAIFLRRSSDSQIVQRVSTVAHILEPRYMAWLGHMNREGYDVFASMNTLAPDARGRTKADIAEIKHLYVDIDHGGQETINKILASDKVPQPNYVLNTSPGKYQAIWKVSAIDKDQAEARLRGLVAEFQTDPAATDATRVLRVPGFANNKYPEKPLVIARRFSHAVHSPGAFQVREDIAPAQVWQASGRTMPAGYRSESERDWGWTMHRLEKGVPPSVVERELAQKAVERGKHGGNDRLVERYAHRTVEKAVQHMRHAPAERQRPSPSPEFAR